jgi:hypothetical protein
MEQQELSFIAGGNTVCYSHFERQFGNFLENKNTHHKIQLLFSLVITCNNQKPTSHKNLHTDNDSSFIHKRSNLEVTKTSFSKRMDSEMFLSANIK